MTMLNTIANLASKWPTTLFLLVMETMLMTTVGNFLEAPAKSTWCKRWIVVYVAVVHSLILMAVVDMLAYDAGAGGPQGHV